MFCQLSHIFPEACGVHEDEFQYILAMMPVTIGIANSPPQHRQEKQRRCGRASAGEATNFLIMTPSTGTHDTELLTKIV